MRLWREPQLWVHDDTPFKAILASCLHDWKDRPAFVGLYNAIISVSLAVASVVFGMPLGF
jgi:hypothetical protein